MTSSSSSLASSSDEEERWELFSSTWENVAVEAAEAVGLLDESDIDYILHAPVVDVVGTFGHQVGGHGVLLKLARNQVAKPLVPRELWFYSQVPFSLPSLTPFLPLFGGGLKFAAGELEEVMAAADSPPAALRSSGVVMTRSKEVVRDTAVLEHWMESLGERMVPGHYLMLEDLTRKFLRPCVCDLKFGTRQHGDLAPPQKVRHQTRKCSSTTSAECGLRVCGSKVWDPAENRYIVRSKYDGRRLRADELTAYLRSFLSAGGALHAGVVAGLLDRLLDLRTVMRSQRTFRLYATSLLLIYEGHPAAESRFDLRMVDFAHTYALEPGHESNDGYLVGLATLERLLRELLLDPSPTSA